MTLGYLLLSWFCLQDNRDVMNKSKGKILRSRLVHMTIRALTCAGTVLQELAQRPSGVTYQTLSLPAARTILWNRTFQVYTASLQLQLRRGDA